MNGFTKQAFFYRQRAEQLRQRAQALGSNKAKQQLLDLANGYDWMAERQDTLLEGEPHKGPV